MVYPIKELIGKKFDKVIRNDDSLVFISKDGTSYSLHHEQDCCESVWLEDVVGDIEKHLPGNVILNAYESISDGEDDERCSDFSCTWSFFTIRTAYDTFTIRFFGHSNGYYSETADLYYYEPTEDDLKDSDMSDDIIDMTVDKLVVRNVSFFVINKALTEGNDRNVKIHHNKNVEINNIVVFDFNMSEATLIGMAYNQHTEKIVYVQARIDYERDYDVMNNKKEYYNSFHITEKQIVRASWSEAFSLMPIKNQGE